MNNVGIYIFFLSVTFLLILILFFLKEPKCYIYSFFQFQGITVFVNFLYILPSFKSGIINYSHFQLSDLCAYLIQFGFMCISNSVRINVHIWFKLSDLRAYIIFSSTRINVHIHCLHAGLRWHFSFYRDGLKVTLCVN